jgi:FAD/FMN-containing dehydrogenase
MTYDKTRLSPSVVSRLQEVVGRDGLLTDMAELDGFVIDWRKNFRGPTDAVLLPRNTSQVADLVRLCAELNLPVIPQGGNTGQSGASVPLKDQQSNVIINLSRMNQIREIDRANQSVTVDAGVVLQTLQETAKNNGLYFPLSMGAEGTCQIGGNLSTNAGGTAVLRYGNAREMVLGLEVVLPNGDVWDGLRSLRKDNTGFDLKALFMGAEGTLGIITAASLKLFAQPIEKAVAWVAVPSLQHATNLLSRFRGEFESRLSAFEYVSREQLDLVTQHVVGQTDPLPDKSAGYLLIELSDSIETGTLDAMLQ